MILLFYYYDIIIIILFLLLIQQGPAARGAGRPGALRGGRNNDKL